MYGVDINEMTLSGENFTLNTRETKKSDEAGKDKVLIHVSM